MTDAMEWSLEYNAPQFVDFTKLDSGTTDNFENEEDYFSVDHETADYISKTMTLCNMKNGAKKEQLSNSSSNGSYIKDIELEVVNKTLKQLSVSDLRIKEQCANSVGLKEHEGDLKKNVPSNSAQKRSGPNDKILEASNVLVDSTDIVQNGSQSFCEDNQVGSGDNDDPVRSLSQDDVIPRSLTAVVLSGHKGSKLKKVPLHSRLDSAADCEGRHEASFKSCTPGKDQKTNRGRTLQRGCRRVDEVTSAKKRLSVSVDRGRDMLRLLSPSPSQLEQKTSCKDLLQLDSKRYGSTLSVNKIHSIANSQTIKEDNNEVAMNEIDFVQGLIENNVSLVKEEKLNMNGAVPHTGIPFQPQGNHGITLAKPFSFEERTRQMFMKKEQKIQKILNEEKKAREFHAQPFPEIIYSSAQSKKVVVSTKPLTKQIPFQFHQPQRNQKAALAADPKPVFRAKPAKVLQKEPFVPYRLSQHTTEFVKVTLSTMQRAEQRIERERQKREKETQSEQERLEKERLLKEQEQQENKRLRASTVHKANPIRHYKPMPNLLSSKPASKPK